MPSTSPHVVPRSGSTGPRRCPPALPVRRRAGVARLRAADDRDRSPPRARRSRLAGRGLCRVRLREPGRVGGLPPAAAGRRRRRCPGHRPAGPGRPQGAVVGAAGLATAAVLQAVDGVALKAVVDLWSDAGEDRSSLFAAALALRQVEIGLDALLALLLAAPVLAFGIGLLTAHGGNRLLGALAVVAAGAAAVNGVALALSGFSDSAMVATTVSGAVALVWMLLAAVWSWRRAVLHRP